jgi:hypothetical protein
MCLVKDAPHLLSFFSLFIIDSHSSDLCEAFHRATFAPRQSAVDTTRRLVDMQNQPGADTASYASSIGRVMVRRNRIRLALAVGLLYAVFHLVHFGVPPRGATWQMQTDVDPALRLFPSMPSDMNPPVSPPTLVSRPDPSTVFTRHHHEHPYPGLAHHLSSSIHPSKDILDDTRYILGSAWFFEQDGNLDWMSIGVQALLPTSAKHLVFTCAYSDKLSGLSEEVVARTVLQGRKEYVHVECPLPSWAEISTTMPEREIRRKLDEYKRSRTEIKAWLEMGSGTEADEADPWQKWRTVATSPDATIERNSTTGRTRVLAVTQTLLLDDWEQSPRGNKLGICLSPLRLHNEPRDDPQTLVDQLKDFVEWRIWHRFEGVEIVHWAARDARFGRWVKRLNTVLGLHDTFLAAPSAFHTRDAHRNNYGDQILYLADCLMRHGVTDEWLAMTDTDEYLLPRDDPSAYGAVRRLEHTADNIGTFATPHTYFGLRRVMPNDAHGPPSVEQFPLFPRNAWKDWDTMEKSDGWRREKSIYRTAVTKSIWVHSHTELGRGFWKHTDAPGVAPENNEYPSQLELLHARNPMPAKLVIEQSVDAESLHGWAGTWKEMAELLQRPELSELWDLSDLTQ